MNKKNDIVDVIRVSKYINGDFLFGYEVLYDDGTCVTFWTNKQVPDKVLLYDYIFNGNTFF